MISSYIQEWLDVIENMSNDNTYKLVWGRSILETLEEKNISGDVLINYSELSEKIIRYYWNQICFFNLKQGRGKEPYIVQIVKEMIEEYQSFFGSTIPVWYQKVEPYFKKDKSEFDRIIKNVNRVLNTDVCWRFMNAGSKKANLYVLDRDNMVLTFTEEQAGELRNYRIVLSQLINYKWAQLLEQYNLAPRIASKVKGLSASKIRRNSLKKYRDILLTYYNNNPIDFYTGEKLEIDDVSVDHVIPWSFLYSDDIWNLVLTSKSNNSKKSNTTPDMDEIDKLKNRNKSLFGKIEEGKMKVDLQEAIEYNYVDKFYNYLKM